MNEDKFYLYKHFPVSKNKHFEIQIGKWSQWNFFRFVCSLTRCQDHAGFELDMEILGLYFIIQIYDVRHWNVKKNTWEKE